MLKLVEFFSSVRLTVLILIVLAGVSFLGTLIVNVDVYHSIPFRVLIGLLALNLVFCSAERLPGIWRRLKSQDAGFDKSYFGKPDARDELVLGVSEDEAISAAMDRLGEVGGRVQKAGLSEGTLLYTSRRGWAEFGPYVIHLAVMLVLIGGFIGSGLGFKALMRLYEGDDRDFAAAQGGVRNIPLGFSVRCIDFDIEYYESGLPREYRTWLAVLDEKGIVKDEKVIEVNHPWFYQGIGFYQQDWGEDRLYRFTAKSMEHGDSLVDDISLRETFEVRDCGLVIMPVKDFSDMKMGGEDIFSGLFVHVFFQGELAGHLRLKEEEPVDAYGYRISYKPLPARVWTLLEVVKDPGVPLVWAGFVIFCIGLLLSFAASYQRFWVMVEPGEGVTRVEIRGKAKRNKPAVRRKIEGIKKDLAEKPGKL
jgi:cytochrome c biogenesis protein